jgi:hypothetical protein
MFSTEPQGKQQTGCCLVGHDSCSEAMLVVGSCCMLCHCLEPDRTMLREGSA